MMARHSAIRAKGVVSIFGAAGPALDEVGLSAWIAQAAPGATLVYHRGFLAVDATSVISKLPSEQQRTLRLVASAALRAAGQGLVHLVQARLGPATASPTSPLPVQSPDPPAPPFPSAS